MGTSGRGGLNSSRGGNWVLAGLRPGRREGRASKEEGRGPKLVEKVGRKHAVLGPQGFLFSVSLQHPPPSTASPLIPPTGGQDLLLGLSLPLPQTCHFRGHWTPSFVSFLPSRGQEWW